MSVVVLRQIALSAAPAEAELQSARARHRLRRADRYTSLCVYAADQLLAGLTPDPEAAVLTVSAFGPSETAFETIEDILDVPAEQVSPTKFSHSVHNAAASYLGVAFGLHGPAFALTGYESDLLTQARALSEDLLLAKMAPQALLIAVESRSILTAQAHACYPERFPQPLSDSIRAWLLAAQP